jgi:hypothetical protein
MLPTITSLQPENVGFWMVLSSQVQVPRKLSTAIRGLMGTCPARAMNQHR